MIPSACILGLYLVVIGIGLVPGVDVGDIPVANGFRHYIRAVPVGHHQFGRIVSIGVGIRKGGTIGGGYVVELQMDLCLIDLCGTRQFRVDLIDFVVDSRISAESEFSRQIITAHILCLYILIGSIGFLPTIGIGDGNLVVLHAIHRIPIGIALQGIGIRSPGIGSIGSFCIPYGQGQFGLVYRGFPVGDMDGIVREVLAGNPLECIGPGVLGLHPVIAGIGFCPGVGIVEEAVPQDGSLGIPVHQSAFCRIDGVGILVRVKGRPISGGHIPHRQVKISRSNSNGAAASDPIVGGSIAAVPGLYRGASGQVLVFIVAHMGRIVAALAGSISTVGGDGILDIAQRISVHQLVFVVRRRPIGHRSIAIGLSAIGAYGQGLPENFDIPIDRFQVIPVQRLGPIFIHMEYIEGLFPIRSCLVFVPLGPGSPCCRPITGNSHSILSGFCPIRTGHVGQIVGFLEIAELGHIDIFILGVLIGGRGAQQIPQLVIGKSIPVGLMLAAPGNGDHRSHLEDELIAAGILIVRKGIAGTVAEYRAVGIGFGRPLGIGAADHFIAQAGSIIAGGIHIDLPGASGAGSDGRCAGGTVHQGTPAALSIHHHGSFCSAGCRQCAFRGISIVIHPGAQSNPAFVSGGSEVDLPAFQGAVTARIPVRFHPVDCEVTGRFDGHIIQLEFFIFIVIVTRQNSTFGSCLVGSTGMDFPAYRYGASGNIDPMVRIDSTIMILCNSIRSRSRCYSPGAFDVHRIQGLTLPDIPFQADSATAGFDVQAGIGQVGFLDEAHGGIPTHGRIVPFAGGAIPYGQERGTVIRLGTDLVPVFIGIPVHIPINGFPIIPRLPVGIGIAVELGPLSIVGFPFGTGDPVHPILIGRIIGHAVIGIGVGLVVVGGTVFVQYAGSPSADP